MNAENKKFLEENRHHWLTLRDAFYVKGLDQNTKSNMLRILKEEFAPKYNTDLWCGQCIADMVKMLYLQFEKWEAQQPIEDIINEITNKEDIINEITNKEDVDKAFSEYLKEDVSDKLIDILKLTNDEKNINASKAKTNNRSNRNNGRTA